jgi:hypothetical protein
MLREWVDHQKAHVPWLNQFFGEAIGLLMSWSMTAAVLLELMRRSNNWRTPRNLSPRGRAVHVVFEVTTYQPAICTSMRRRTKRSQQNYLPTCPFTW